MFDKQPKNPWTQLGLKILDYSLGGLVMVSDNPATKEGAESEFLTENKSCYLNEVILYPTQ